MRTKRGAGAPDAWSGESPSSKRIRTFPEALNCFLACANVKPGVAGLLRQVEVGHPGQALDERGPTNILPPVGIRWAT